ncbi:hypothetical protein [Haladaptatus sp. NG-WS-4]
MEATTIMALPTQSKTMTGALTNRRRFVALAGSTIVAALSGCASQTTGDGQTDRTSRTNSTRETTTAELDLREATVVGVEFERDGQSYTFDVTLYHDDDGEQGYANWWQVETIDGKRLGRRELLHAHGTERFTRSETVEIPFGTRRVVVRGHDERHGYGGQAMVVNLESGETRAVQQGSETSTITTTQTSA